LRHERRVLTLAIATAQDQILVPLSAVEERQVAEILPQLEGVLAYESEALAPFAPRYLEFAFNELKVEYAGWPLGGRIDRVDVDAENRAVVIDYKHRTGVEEFKLADPTVRDEESGTAPIDDPRWLPPHTQTLIALAGVLGQRLVKDLVQQLLCARQILGRHALHALLGQTGMQILQHVVDKVALFHVAKARVDRLGLHAVRDEPA